MTSVTSLIVRLFSILCLKQLQVVGVAESLHDGKIYYLGDGFRSNLSVFRHDQARGGAAGQVFAAAADLP